MTRLIHLPLMPKPPQLLQLPPRRLVLKLLSLPLSRRLNIFHLLPQLPLLLQLLRLIRPLLPRPPQQLLPLKPSQLMVLPLRLLPHPLPQSKSKTQRSRPRLLQGSLVQAAPSPT